MLFFLGEIKELIIIETPSDIFPCPIYNYLIRGSFGNTNVLLLIIMSRSRLKGNHKAIARFGDYASWHLFSNMCGTQKHMSMSHLIAS